MEYVEYGFTDYQSVLKFRLYFDHIFSKTKIKKIYVSNLYYIVGFETYDEDETYKRAFKIDKTFKKF